MTTRPICEARLHMLFRAIAARDAGEASRLLQATPSLATEAAHQGATRQEAKDYFSRRYCTTSIPATPRCI